MSEIEKLYENANVEKEWKPLPYGGIDEFYPPFTAEKQIELIKWLAKRQDFGLNYYPNSKMWVAQTQFSWEFYSKTYEHKEFKQALAGLINNLWQDLTDTEKAEIKRILE